MAKRKKRFRARHPEEFEKLDEELTKALDALAQRNRETEGSLGKFASAETDHGLEDDSPGAKEQHARQDESQ